MYKLVVFDLDGTLADSLEDLADAVNVGLSANGFPIHSVDAYRQMVGSGRLNLIKRAVAPVTDEDAVMAVLNKYDEYYKEHSIDKTCAYNGVEKLLKALSDKGIVTAVLSNKPDEFVGKILNKLFPDHIFKFAWGKKSEYEIKPCPDALLAIMEMTNVKREECIYVGDSNVDCFTAHNAGVKCCGVSWGFRGKDELVSAGADVIIDTPMELLEKFDI